MLAAGAGVRYGSPKAPVAVDGERLVDRSVRLLREAGCAPVIVVLGAWIGDVPHAEVVINEDWQEGMGSSLRAGLSALGGTDASAALVTLVDLPGLTSLAIRAVCEHEGGLVAATYDGSRGHPVKFPRVLWEDVIANTRGDEGARTFLRDRTDLVLVEVGHLARGDDMDVAAEK